MSLSRFSRIRGLSRGEAAAHWTVRQDIGNLSASEEAELAAWRSNLSNEAAYRAADGALHLFDDHRLSDPHLNALRQAALETTSAPRTRWAIAAALAVSIGLGATQTTLRINPSSQPGAPSPSPQLVARVPEARIQPIATNEYVTRLGERRSIRLPDGTSVTLDTGSRLVVAYSGARRLVRLVTGQALFEVVHDPSRPFTVEAASRWVTALGTVFEVRVDPNRLKVVLVRGSVVVARIPDPANPTIAEPAVLKPGQQLSVAFGAPVRLARVDVERQLMWRDGFVDFDDVTLGAAVAEINRYTDRPITIAEPGIASLRVSGVFRTGSPDAFVKAVSTVLPVTARSGPNGALQLTRAGG